MQTLYYYAKSECAWESQNTKTPLGG